MVDIQIAPGQTVETTDPHVRITVSPIPSIAAVHKIVLVVVTDDGRESAPVELPLDTGPAPP